MIPAKRLVVNDLHAPVLLEVIQEARILTLRVYEEVRPAPDDANTLVGVCSFLPAAIGEEEPHLGKHLGERQLARLGSRIPIEGEVLDARFKGKLFAEIGASTLNMDAERGVLSGVEWADRSLWMFGLNTGLPTAAPVAPVNLVCENFSQKALARRFAAARNVITAMMLHVPFRTYDISESSLLIRCHPDYGYIGNVTFEPSTLDVVGKLGADFELVAGGGEIAADGTATAVIRAVCQRTGAPVDDAQCTVYLETTAGYLPHSRVEMKNGEASFRVSALGLKPGETFKVKAGYRLFTGVVDVPFVVV